MTTWVALRAAGIAAYVMLFLSVSWGLVATTSIVGRRVARATATTLHQFMATCGLLLLAAHVAGLLVDTFVRFSLADVTIPLFSSFRPVSVGLGIVAMYLAVFVIVASWLRRPIGARWWRRTHLLSVPAFVLALVHGIFAGTDSARPVMWWTYVTTGLIVVFLLVVRGLTTGAVPRRAPAPTRRPASPLEAEAA